MWKSNSKTKEPDNTEKAYDYAVFLLSLKLRTMGELLQKMQGRGYTETVISGVLEQLKQNHYIDDQRYAEVFLENLKAYRNFGYYGIKKKFMEKKLPMDLIERVLGEGLSVAEEIKIAKRLLKKEKFEQHSELSTEETVHYRTYEDTELNKQKQKMTNRLRSRGFRGEVISRVVF